MLVVNEFDKLMYTKLEFVPRVTNLYERLCAQETRNFTLSFMSLCKINYNYPKLQFYLFIDFACTGITIVKGYLHHRIKCTVHEVDYRVTKLCL